MNGTNRVVRLMAGGFISAALALAALASGAGSAAADEGRGAVYALTNESSNAVAVFQRAPDGQLRPAGLAPTGGAGTGASLGDQGALALSHDGRWLFAVNAASNDITVFAVRERGLQWVSRTPSGGLMPISLTAERGLLYVLNAGGAGNISGFRVGRDGDLTPIAGSTRPLSNNGAGAAPGPAQVSFSPSGDALVVSEKASSKLDVYRVDAGGAAGNPTVVNSNGAVPFGFAFDRNGALIVSEAGPGALSSYRLVPGGLQVVSASVTTHQAAPCWVAVSGNGRYAYTTNAHSGNLSGFRVGPDGSLTALNPADGITGVTGGAPLDIALSLGSRYLYVNNAGTHTINAFAVREDGSLSPIAVSGVSLPASAAGLAAR